ncbi:MAG: zinc dependent phospholipase C family protein [Brevinematia bacterium]
MPKEIVHWAIAEIARQNLSENSLLKKAIDNHHSEYLIGSIAFDIPYYDFFARDSKEMNKVGSRLHGINLKKAETHYVEIITYYGKNPPEYVWAFIAGSFCHAITDITFHPVVNSIAKDSIEKHRKIETELDLFYLDRVKLPSMSMSKILSRIRIKRNDFLTLLSLFIFGKNKNFNEKVSSILIKYKLFQYIIRKRFFHFLFNIINSMYKNRFKEFLPLFYKNFKKRNFQIFENPLVVSEKNLEKNATKEILKGFERLEKLIKKSDNFSEIKDFFKDFYFPPLTGEN